jgi:hypothetical protein
MAADRGNIQPTIADPLLQNIIDRRAGKPPYRRFAPEEKLAQRALWARAFQIAGENITGFIGQGELQGLLRFGLLNMQNAGTPINIVQGQANQLPTPQTITGRKIQQGEIPLIIRLGAVDGSEQCDDLLPGQCPRQLFQSVSARRIDLLMQWPPEYALGMLALEKAPQDRDDVL